MGFLCRFHHVVLAVWVFSCFSAAQAQMSVIQTPLVGSGHSFYESSSINWGLRGRNFYSQFGGGAPRPFGIGGAAGGMSTGIGFSGGGFRGGLGLNWVQGSDSFNSVVAPSLTVTDGLPGFMFAGTHRPFVMGLSPVVSSSSYRPPAWGLDYAALVQNQMLIDAQMAAAQHQSQELAKQRADKAIELLRRADEASAGGDTKKARNFLYAAKKFADGPLADEVTRKLQQK